MNLPARVVEIVHNLYQRNLDLARGSEDNRRALTRMIAEQNRFELGENWGLKSTTASHPQSKDTLVYRNLDGSLDIWDWQNGDTRAPQIHANKPPDFPNMNHYFISVLPVNHLNVVINPPDDDDDDDEVDDNNSALVSILAAVTQMVSVLKDVQANQILINNHLQILVDKEVQIQPIKFPDYKGSLGFNITLKPQEPQK